jgi:hypothetical protein
MIPCLSLTYYNHDYCARRPDDYFNQSLVFEDGGSAGGNSRDGYGGVGTGISHLGYKHLYQQPDN